MTTDLLTETIAHEAPPPEPVVSQTEVVEISGPSIARITIGAGCASLAAALMVGGIFQGIGGRTYGAVAVASGIALALGVRRLQRPLVANLLVVAGVFAIGLALLVPFGDVFRFQSLVAKAIGSTAVLRPPVPLTSGWLAILGWLLALVGFLTTWVGTVVRRPAPAVVIPMAVAAVAGISVPHDQQIATGVAAVVLLGVALGVLSGTHSTDSDVPLSFQLRRAIRALPLLAVITVALAALAQTNFFFPKPLYDPTHRPTRPKAIPLSKANDRVLFEVESSISGPWRIGSLDVYDGKDWLLAPFAESKLTDIGRSGVIDRDLQPGVKARFKVAGLTGAVLPGLPNMVAIVAQGPKLTYDERIGSIRLAEGEAQAGLTYAVTAANLPTLKDLRSDTAAAPPDLHALLDIPAPPPGVRALLARAPKTSKWDTFDFLRTTLLDKVTAAGQGVPTAVPPARVDAMLQNGEGSPFEIVAAQAMLARWAGIPSRIGYGFDGGDLVNGVLEVRPRNGATFVEVYFPKFKWLPVIGTPKQAKPSTSTEQATTQILPSGNIGVELAVPEIVPRASVSLQRVRNVAGATAAIAAIGALLYYAFPALRKLVIRSRRRAAAMEEGPAARVANAYAEWRDFAADLGFHFPSDTPLMFLERFVPDEEHRQLAWLVTRGLWGDMRDAVDDDVAAAAEELSRSLRRRLSGTQPFGVRAVGAVSRISVRHPYAIAPATRDTEPLWRHPRARLAGGAAAAAVWIAVAAMIASAVTPPPAGLRVDRLGSNVAFGVRVPHRAAPRQPVPPAVAPAPAPVPVVPPFYRAAPLKQNDCPEAALNSFPAQPATLNIGAPPRKGLYRFQHSGKEPFQNALVHFAVPLYGFEQRAVRRVATAAAVFDPQATDKALAYTFQSMRVLSSGIKEISTYKVNTAATAADPERGLALTAFEIDDPNGRVITSFTPATGLLLLPLPVQQGTSFTAIATSGDQTAQLQSNVIGRRRVDACGEVVDGWLARGTLTVRGAPSYMQRYEYIVATQLGGLVIFESRKGTNQFGDIDAKYALGRLRPDPLPEKLE